MRKGGGDKIEEVAQEGRRKRDEGDMGKKGKPQECARSSGAPRVRTEQTVFVYCPSFSTTLASPRSAMRRCPCLLTSILAAFTESGRRGSAHVSNVRLRKEREEKREEEEEEEEKEREIERGRLRPVLTLEIAVNDIGFMHVV